MDFRKRSTQDQKPSDFEVSELLDRADEEYQNNTEFIRLPTKKRKMPLTNLLEISAKQRSEVTASVADRRCLSVRQQLMYQSTIIC